MESSVRTSQQKRKIIPMEEFTDSSASHKKEIVKSEERVEEDHAAFDDVEDPDKNKVFERHSEVAEETHTKRTGDQERL